MRLRHRIGSKFDVDRDLTRSGHKMSYQFEIYLMHGDRKNIFHRIYVSIMSLAGFDSTNSNTCNLPLLLLGLFCVKLGRKSLVAQESCSLQGVIPASLITGYPRSKIILPGGNQVLSCMRQENCNNTVKCAAVTFQCASTSVKTATISYRN